MDNKYYDKIIRHKGNMDDVMGEIDGKIGHQDRYKTLNAEIAKRGMALAKKNHADGVAFIAAWASATIIDDLRWGYDVNLPATSLVFENLKYAKKVLAGKVKFRAYILEDEYEE